MELVEFVIRGHRTFLDLLGGDYPSDYFSARDLEGVVCVR
jgi:hypothetical protein